MVGIGDQVNGGFVYKVKEEENMVWKFWYFGGSSEGV